MRTVFLFLISASLLLSCDSSSDKKIKARSTGRFNELLVVAPQNDWEGDIGFALKKILTQEVLGLPQPEPQFSVLPIEPKIFDKILSRNRNILIINKGKKEQFKISKDLHASPQIVIEIDGPDDASIIKLIEQNAEALVSTYKTSDLKALQLNPGFAPVDPKDVTFFNKQGLLINIPDNYEKVDDKDNFVWYRNETYNPGVDISGSMNLIAYTLPLNGSFEQVKDSIATYRDRIGKKEIPGPREGNYMITEAAYTPHIFEVTFNGMNAFKTLGKWEIKDGFMAGPFINYTIEDIKNKRIIVVEGFVYAPSVNKRDYMFELEAILGTLKIN